MTEKDQVIPNVKMISTKKVGKIEKSWENEKSWEKVETFCEYSVALILHIRSTINLGELKMENFAGLRAEFEKKFLAAKMGFNDGFFGVFDHEWAPKLGLAILWPIIVTLDFASFNQSEGKY